MTKNNYENRREPPLRFPDFKECWNKMLLGDIGDFIKGQGLSKAVIEGNGKTPCVLYGELYTRYKEVIDRIYSYTNAAGNVKSETGDVLLPSSTTTKHIDLANARALLQAGVLLGGDIIVIRNTWNRFDPVYLAYYLTHFKKQEIAKLAQGITIIHLYARDLKKLKIYLPSLPEQRKIAAFFSTLDDLIENIKKQKEKLEKLKKGLMQRLFPKKGERIPELRFKGFEGEWREVKLAKLEEDGKIKIGRGTVISRKNISSKPGPYPVYSSSTKNNGILGYWGNFMFEDEMVTWSIDGGGDFFYRPRHKFSITNVSGFIEVRDKSCINVHFLYLILATLKKRKYFDYQFKAHPSVIKDLYRILLPSKQEQDRISITFLLLERMISRKQQLIEKLETFKKAFLQKMLI